MNKSNTLYWKTATDPAERIEVRLVLNSYIDNDNLYAGLESRSKDNYCCPIKLDNNKNSVLDC